METTKENNKNNEKKARPGLKLLLIAGMCVAFLIPQALIQNLVSERQGTERSAENEVFEKWGGNQTLTGPFIEVTYSWNVSTERHAMILLPEQLEVKGDVSTKALKRGIYDFTTYETELDLTGQFKLPKDFDKNQHNKTWHFEDARIVVDITNLRGLRDNVTFNLDGTKYDMEACGEYWNGLSCPIDLSCLLDGKTLDFAVTIPFKGSGNLMFAPLGQTTVVNLNSDCTTPSFNGYYLPDERQVNDNGFQASWKVLAINRDYPQFFSRNSDNNRQLSSSTFGVNLKVPVEQYQQTDRAIKYAFLIILLTFAAVFFVEMRKATPIHPVQYLLIGIALIIFYTLLLSFSEHINFGLSYLIASVMTIGLIVAFMASIAKDRKTALGIGLLLTVLYTFIYVLLQLESYALLVGSVGLFIILGIAMFATQKIDWYKKKD
jgi:inner membrane protein